MAPVCIRDTLHGARAVAPATAVMPVAQHLTVVCPAPSAGFIYNMSTLYNDPATRRLLALG
jgi:hypothetical protein